MTPERGDVEVVWHGSLPKKVKERLKVIVEGRFWVLPSWCTTLIFDYEAGSNHRDRVIKGELALAVAQVTARPEYHRATVTIYPGWIKEPESIQPDRIVHELAHVATLPLIHAVDEILKLVPDRKIRDIYRERLIDINEAMTCDLAEATIYAQHRLDRLYKRTR